MLREGVRAFSWGGVMVSSPPARRFNRVSCLRVWRNWISSSEIGKGSAVAPHTMIDSDPFWWMSWILLSVLSALFYGERNWMSCIGHHVYIFIHLFIIIFFSYHLYFLSRRLCYFKKRTESHILVITFIFLFFCSFLSSLFISSYLLFISPLSSALCYEERYWITYNGHHIYLYIH